MYCLDDGSALLDGPGSFDGPQTALFQDRLSAETEATAVFRADSAEGRTRTTLPGVGTRPKNKYWVIGLVVLLVSAIALFAVYQPWGRSTGENRENRPVAIDRLTTNGRATSAAISADGKYVIYGVDEGGKDSLWLRQVATSSNIQIFPAAEDVFYWGLTFTPDSTYVNFIKAEFEKNKSWGLSQMAIIGGAQKDLMTGIEGPISYSPDGKQFAFIRDEFPTDQQSSLMVANADGTGERVLASRTSPETFPARQIGPAWSPDGTTIAAIIADQSTLINKMDVVEVGVADGSIKPVTTQEWKYISQIAWLNDKSGLLVAGSDRASSSYTSQIWYFSYAAGGARRVTTDFLDYRSLSLNADSSLLVTVQSSSIANIWAADTDISRPVQVRAGGNNEEGMGGLSVMPDGRILFFSRAAGNDDIWVMNADGSSPKQLTNGPGSNFHPVASPDGQYVVFTSLRDSKVNIWRMRPDGSSLVQLTSGGGDYRPDISPDSRWVVYISETNGNPYLWKVPIDGGEPVRLIDNFAANPRISPDGKWIVCGWRKDHGSTWRYAVIPFEGGQPIKVFDLVGTRSRYHWAPDSRSLYYLRDTQGGVTNIWNLPLPEGEPKQVTDYKTESIHEIAWSVDGKKLVMSKGTNTSDVVMLRGF
jgi:Tol biopolymer transport system component